jgi:error-prone DNA polymerase
VPAEDPAVYEMISAADTMGVFQIESRAQMAMLPRLRPRCFYDLVIEVAIIRPGPIQGDMVHPYLGAGTAEEPVSYPSEEVRQVLERTLGVPIFQEQVMQLAIVAAGFSAGEADQLRRAMAAWRRKGGLGPLRGRASSRACAGAVMTRSSRGASSTRSGLRRVRLSRVALRELRAAGLRLGLAEAPRAGGLPVRAAQQPADGLLCAVAAGAGRAPPRRRGAPGGRAVPATGTARWTGRGRCAGGAARPAAGGGAVCGRGERLVAARRASAFESVDDLARRARLDRGDLAALARADAFAALAGHRHRAGWAVAGVEPALPLLEGTRIREGLPLLRAPTEGAEIVADYRSTGLTLGATRWRCSGSGWRTTAWSAPPS